MTTKRDKYLKWKHELFDSCGQCMGFRAKGINLSEVNANNPCQPGKDCHTSCAALGMGKIKGNRGQKSGVDQINSSSNNHKSNLIYEPDTKSYIEQKCFNCDNNEENVALLPCRHKGKSLWVCTKCLPVLIHG